MTIRKQMILLIAGPTLLIYGVILGLAAVYLHERSRVETEQALLRLAGSYAARLDGYLREGARVAQTTAQFMKLAPRLSDDEVYEQLEQGVTQMPLIYGACIAFEPGTRKPAGELFAPYVCRSGNAMRRVNIDRNVYDWFADSRYTWYSEPRRLRHGVWSDPYFDEGAGNILMSTYSAPFFLDAGGFGGVCTVDIDLPRLRTTVGAQIDEQLDFVILAPDGRFIYHPDSSRIMSGTLMEYASQAGETSLLAVAEPLRSGRTGVAWIDGWDSAEPLGVFYAPVPSTGWIFVCRMPAQVVLHEVQKRMLLGGSALVATLLLIGACVYVVAGRLAAPISRLEQKVMEVSQGHLDTHIEETASSTELRNLACSFNRMTSDLQANLDRLATEQAARQRIERDLDIAREIQQGLLPTSKPDVQGYEVAGWSQPADKTGGDYYDWQILPDGRLFVSLADVSGHGVGPALVTAVCRAYVRASVVTNHNLSYLLNRLNDLLIADLPEGRFVTFACILLDPRRHEAQLISAGHGPLFRCLTSRGELIESEPTDVPLGILANYEYGPPTVFSFEPGDFMIFLTDGLFEWANASQEQFGLERLQRAILASATAPADHIIRNLYEQARAFAGAAPQLDDITAVVLQRLT